MGAVDRGPEIQNLYENCLDIFIQEKLKCILKKGSLIPYIK